MGLYLRCWMLWNFDFLFYLTFRDFYPIFHSSVNTITNARAATSDSEPTVHEAVNWATAGKAEDEAQQVFILCTSVVTCASLKNPWFWAVLWILQKLMFISRLISAWFPVWKPGSRCFTCSFLSSAVLYSVHRSPSGALLQSVVWPRHRHPLELSHQSHPSLHHSPTAKLLAHLVRAAFWN